MSSLWRAVTCTVSRLWACPLVQPTQHRALATTATACLKKIVAEDDGKTLTIEGQMVTSPREGRVVKVTGDGCPCILCQLRLNIKHTDVLILSQFLRSDGCMMPRRVSGICRLQQRRIQQMVKMSQKAGLMPNLAPAWSKRDPKLRYGYKKYNKYFDESTIIDVRPRPSLEQLGGPPLRRPAKRRFTL